MLGICCAPGSNAVQTINPAAPTTAKKVVLHHVSFDDEHAIIEPDSAPVLDEAAAILQHTRHVTVVVASDPSVRIDSATAAEHAEAVRDYFVAHGVSAARIQNETAVGLLSSCDIAVAVRTHPPAWK